MVNKMGLGANSAEYNSTEPLLIGTSMRQDLLLVGFYAKKEKSVFAEQNQLERELLFSGFYKGFTQKREWDHTAC